MVLNSLKCNRLTRLGLKESIRWILLH